MFLLDEYYVNLNLLKKQHKKLITNNFLHRDDLEFYSRQEKSILFFDFNSLILLCEDNDIKRIYFYSCCFEEFLSAVTVLKPQVEGDIVFEYISKEMESIGITKNSEDIEIYAILNKWQTMEINLKCQPIDDTFVFDIAKKQDIIGIQELFNNSFDKFISHLPNNEVLQKLMSDDLVFCCYYREKIVGVVCFERIGRNGLYLYQIAIEPELKGSGIGWSLAQFAYSKFETCKVFTSWVDEKNIVSEKLHSKLGFKKMPLKTMVFLMKNHK